MSTTTAADLWSDAQRGLAIMRRSGEEAGRRFLTEHQHPAVGPATAARSGTIILEDGSSVAITPQHYAFRWTNAEHEFSLSHPTSGDTAPWPEQDGPPDLVDITCARIVERYEERVRAERGDEKPGRDKTVVKLAEARRLAPAMWELARKIVVGLESPEQLVDLMGQFVEECADEVAVRMPDTQQDALWRAVSRAIEAADRPEP